MPAAATKPNTKEKGTVSNSSGASGLLTWGSLIDDTEFAPDLRWPASVWVYDKMRRSDAQCKALLSGTILPLTRFRYMIDPNGASDKLVQELSQEIKLPVKGKEDEFSLGRTRNRFTWKRHLPVALKALVYGHYGFEQVMYPPDEARFGDDLYHIKKVEPRPPYTISEINTEKDGSLKGIKQTAVAWQMGMSSINSPGIPVSALLWYVWDKEGANWTGESLLRPCFKNYIIKDMLMRIDAMKHERLGLGVPWFEAPEGASQDLIDALDELAQEVRAGDESGLAAPHGTKLHLAGMAGSVPDTVASINLQNEEMARAFLMMFVQLGQTETGSRALGSEFIEFFNYAQEGIADWATETFNEYMIEDWVDWNYGEDEPAPRVVYSRAADEDLPVQDLVALIDKKAIQVDPELESFIRQKYKMPKLPDDFEPPEPPAPPPPAQPPAPAKAGAGRRRAKAAGEDAGAPSPSLPDRALRRQPYEHEVAAATDFARMDEEWNRRRDELFDSVTELQAAQVDEIYDLIVEANGDQLALAKMEIDDVTHERILASMQEMADEGIDQAAQEAIDQGVTSPNRPNLSDLEDSLTARAQGVGQVITRELAAAAGNKAISLSGGSLGPEDVAEAVKDHLNGLAKARVRDQLGGAITTAQNSGRKIVMQRNDADSIYSSELLDANTCQNCKSVDGTEYESVEDAESDYPGGGYMSCKGGDRCRGTLVATYGEEAPAL